ncbi:hypothetical protein H257_15552 [Aphanomyces astaci]|uniref:Uncharacterized protein n=1 Tax=Aphanomyces astaci TaxID=112090 RepID=W4FP40_APHAT|nr:hypothetical protein H257_15552 [Aphanomyces astaci]ETV68574.1 hypothetical protein H257_15552 [Aphanomyces astaci]|eukprot:XP_009842003.1 hypothetical protein H257_15552 [Aphanomyces astaci]
MKDILCTHFQAKTNHVPKAHDTAYPQVVHPVQHNCKRHEDGHVSAVQLVFSNLQLQRLDCSLEPALPCFPLVTHHLVMQLGELHFQRHDLLLHVQELLLQFRLGCMVIFFLLPQHVVDDCTDHLHGATDKCHFHWGLRWTGLQH